MKATYKTKMGNLDFQLDGEIKEIWKQLSTLQEVFENTTCGCCKGTDIRFIHRNVDSNDFYEMLCNNPKCRAKLAMGQHKKNGTMFPKRKDEEGKWIPNNGWTIYKPGAAESSGEESPTPTKTAAKTTAKSGSKAPQGKTTTTKTKPAAPPEPEDSGDDSGDDGSEEAPF